MIGAEDAIPAPDEADLARIRGVLKAVGGQQVAWGAAQVLDVWIIEQRLRADRLATRHLTRVTWVLAVATAGLLIATIGLVIATARS